MTRGSVWYYLYLCALSIGVNAAGEISCDLLRGACYGLIIVGAIHLGEAQQSAGGNEHEK